MRSVRSLLFIALVVGIALMVMGLSLSQVLQVKQTNRLVDLSEHNVRMAALPLSVRKIVQLFENDVQGRGETSINEWSTATAIVINTLGSIEPEELKNHEISAYSRTLNSMFNHYIRSAKRHMQLDRMDSAAYDEVVFLGILGDYLALRAEQLVVVYLETRTHREAQFLKIYRLRQWGLFLTVLFLMIADLATILFLLRVPPTKTILANDTFEI